jgi:hypothetical protein
LGEIFFTRQHDAFEIDALVRVGKNMVVKVAAGKQPDIRLPPVQPFVCVQPFSRSRISKKRPASDARSRYQ